MDVRVGCESDGRSVRLVLIARKPRYPAVKQWLLPSAGLPPSARMGRRRTRLWALFQCCNPMAKAKMRKDVAWAQVLEAEWPEVRAAGGLGPSDWPSPDKELGLCFILLAWLWALPARVIWP